MRKRKYCAPKKDRSSRQVLEFRMRILADLQSLLGKRRSHSNLLQHNSDFIHRPSMVVPVREATQEFASSGSQRALNNGDLLLITRPNDTIDTTRVNAIKWMMKMDVVEPKLRRAGHSHNSHFNVSSLRLECAASASQWVKFTLFEHAQCRRRMLKVFHRIQLHFSILFSGFFVLLQLVSGIVLLFGVLGRMQASKQTNGGAQCAGGKTCNLE